MQSLLTEILASADGQAIIAGATGGVSAALVAWFRARVGEVRWREYGTGFKMVLVGLVAATFALPMGWVGGLVGTALVRHTIFAFLSALGLRQLGKHRKALATVAEYSPSRPVSLRTKIPPLKNL